VFSDEMRGAVTHTRAIASSDLHNLVYRADVDRPGGETNSSDEINWKQTLFDENGLRARVGNQWTLVMLPFKN